MAPPSSLYEWTSRRFAVGSDHARRSIETLGPDLDRLVTKSTSVLDLCCGAGIWSFFMEERGADVTGIDITPDMIGLARQAAAQRESDVTFLLADLLAHDLGEGRFDLALLMGNTIADFSPRHLATVVATVHRALRPRGRFVVGYLDGVSYLDRERTLGEGVEQEEPMRITWRFREYVPDEGAWVVTYRNESTDEEYDYTSYVYPTPLLRQMLRPWFALEASSRHGEATHVDVFRRRDPEPSPLP